MKFYQLTLPLSVLTLCVSQQLYANDSNTEQNEADMPSVTLEAITVVADSKTGTALAQKISEMPAVTQVIFEDEIAQQATGNRTVGDILGQLVPSIGTGSGSTSNYATTMRGRPLQYLLNGVPLTGSRNISRQLNSIDPTQLERIEVLSGATSIYGSGATGGLINLITKSVAGYGLQGQSRIGISSNRDFNSESLGYNVGQSIGYADNNDIINARLDVDYESKGGNFDSGDKRISPDVFQTDQQDTKTLSVNANIGWQMSENQRLNLATTHYDNQQDTEYGADYGQGLSVLLKGEKPSLKAIKGVAMENQPYSTKNSINLNYHNKDILGSNLSVTGYYRDEEGRFYPSAQEFSKQAQAYLTANGITDPKTIKKLASMGAVVLQSEADIEVKGVRTAMQTPIQLADNKEALFSYGFDYENEKDKQTYYGQDVMTFMGSNGLNIKPTGQTYFGGPDTTVNKWGAFINADVDVTDKLHASAGVRYQNIEVETDAFTPRAEQIFADYSNNPYVKKATQGRTYSAGKVSGGSAENDKTLFNLGVNYQLNDKNSVFANFSQGFAFADVQRSLRDVKPGFVLSSESVEPMSVDSYELGWQTKTHDTTAKLTGFYNNSDKTVKFKNHKVEVLNNDERVYGAEASISHQLDDNWTVGSSLAYTSGQYKDGKSGDWIELDATRITPLKGTAFAQYNFDGGSNIRLQATALDGTDKAYQDNQTLAKKDRIQMAYPVKGYVTADLVGQVKLKKGHLNYGIYNLTNTDYKNVYHQSTYGDMNRLDAKGTNYGLSYTIDY